MAIDSGAALELRSSANLLETVVLAALIAFAPITRAQPSPPSVQQPDTADDKQTPAQAPPPTPAATVQPNEARRTKEFPGIAWGNFLLFPELSLSATHDDNIYARRRFPARDMVYTLSPSLEAKSNWQRHALNFDVGLDADRYDQYSAENTVRYWGGFDGRYDFAPLTNVFGGARFSRNHEDRSVSGALTPTQQAGPTLYTRGEAHLGFAMGWGAWRIRAGGTYDEFNYKDGLSDTGTVIDSDFRDRTAHSLGLRLAYVVSPRYEIFAQYASDTRNYRNNITGRTFNRDSEGYRAALGVRLNLTQPSLTGEILAGRLKQDFDFNGFAGVSAPYYGAQLTWHPTPMSTVSGFIDRALEETTVTNSGVYASSSLDTTFGIEVEHKLSSQLTLTGRAAYTRSTFQSFARQDSIVDAGAGLRYYVAPQIFVGADARLINRHSSDVDARYSRSQFMLIMGYTPARAKDYLAGSESSDTTAWDSHGGFHAGAEIGHGTLATTTSGPRGGGGSDTGDMGWTGARYGLFAGWGREFGRWYLGVELDGSGGGLRWDHRKDKDDSRTMSVQANESYGLSVRAGYLLEGGLLYGRVGAVRTRFATYYTENQFSAGAYNREHSESAMRWGAGMDIPASSNLFVRVGYSYTDYGSYDVPYQSGANAVTTEKFELRTAQFNVGLGWRFSAGLPRPARRSAATLRGLYAGGAIVHGTLGTLLTGRQRDQNTGPFDFSGEFAGAGAGAGFFIGYGHTFGPVYAGLEFEAEAANHGWYHERQTGGGGGRDFAAEKRGGYGGAFRVGYALPNGSLLYGRIGRVRTSFNTIYNKGTSAAQWIDRSERVAGTRFGVGAEVPATRNAFVRMDYTRTHYDSYGFVTGHGGGANADEMVFSHRANQFQLGVGFRF